MISDILVGPWQISAGLALATLLLGRLLLPGVLANSSVLAPLAVTLAPLTDILALIFASIAVVKIVFSKKNTPSESTPQQYRTKPPVQQTKNRQVSPDWGRNTSGGIRESHRTPPTGSPGSGSIPPDVQKESQDKNRQVPPAWGRNASGGIWESYRTPPTGSPGSGSIPPDVQKESQESPAPSGKPVAWSLEVLQRVEWKRFEDLCAAYYTEKGIRCETTPLGPDGGIDIRLYQDVAAPRRTTAIVQCKAMRIVGIKPMRELLGVMVHEKVDKGFFMTSGEFTQETKAFGQDNRVLPIDGKALLMMIQRLSDDSQKRLLNMATDGDWMIPTCPECGQKMLRKDPVGRKPFWSCKRGRCKGRLDIRHEWR